MALDDQGKVYGWGWNKVKYMVTGCDFTYFGLYQEPRMLNLNISLFFIFHCSLDKLELVVMMIITAHN